MVLVYRDQLIGNRQLPVSDYAATLDNYDSYSGQVISIGENLILLLRILKLQQEWR